MKICDKTCTYIIWSSPWQYNWHRQAWPRTEVVPAPPACPQTVAGFALSSAASSSGLRSLWSPYCQRCEPGQKLRLDWVCSSLFKFCYNIIMGWLLKFDELFKVCETTGSAGIIYTYYILTWILLSFRIARISVILPKALRSNSSSWLASARAVL